MTNSSLGLQPQEISNSLWAYAKISCPDHGLFMALADAACAPNIEEFKPQELSNTAWAFATVLLRHNVLFEKLAAAAIRKRKELRPQNCANLLWAYTKLQAGKYSGICRVLLEETLRQLPDYHPQEISSIIWAAVREEDPIRRRLFDAVAAHCSNKLSTFPFQALANMFKAFAAAGGHTSFLQEMSEECLKSLDQFDRLGLITLFSSAVLIYSRHGDEKPWAAQSASTLASLLSAKLNELQNKDISSVNNSLQVVAWSKPNIPQELVELNAAVSVLVQQHGITKRKGPKLMPVAKSVSDDETLQGGDESGPEERKSAHGTAEEGILPVGLLDAEGMKEAEELHDAMLDFDEMDNMALGIEVPNSRPVRPAERRA